MRALGRSITKMVWTGLVLGASLGLGAQAQTPQELVVLIDDATEMPLQNIRQGKLLEGCTRTWARRWRRT
jgi:hypothetical protein